MDISKASPSYLSTNQSLIPTFPLCHYLQLWVSVYRNSPLSQRRKPIRLQISIRYQYGIITDEIRIDSVLIPY